MRTRATSLVAAIAIVALLAIGAGIAVTTGEPAAPGNSPAAPSSSAAPNTAPASPTPPPVIPVTALTHPAGKLVGVALPGSSSGLAAFAAASGTSPDVNETFVNWGALFPTGDATTALGQGAYTLVSWQSENEPLARIASGADDAYITAFARSVAAFRDAVYIDFDHEFNGDWYPWGTQAVSPGQFTAAWRHLHQLFDQAGAANAVWVWSPNVVNPVPGVELAAYWPGAAEVDVVGIVGYYTGQLGESTYAGLFTRTEGLVDAFAHKPYLITEAGAQQGPDKAAWVADLLAGVKNDPGMLGVIYFDEGSAQHKRADWTLEDSGPALAAWRAGVRAMPLAPAA
jgi:hypothetical protein